MFLQTIFVSLMLLAFGVALCAAGFRLFVVLLPVIGFFAGFIVTAQSIQQLFGGGFLATTGSWVFGFFVGLIFAVVAYLFYYAAIVILAGTAGYELGVGLIAGLGVTSGVLHFIVGMVVALAFAVGVVVFNLPRILIIVLSSLLGAGMILSGILVGLGRIPLVSLQYGIFGDFVHLSWFWTLVFLVIAAAGVALQLYLPTQYMVQPYDEEEYIQRTGASGPAITAPSSPGDESGGAPPEGVPAV